jgi:hypothetical protein
MEITAGVLAPPNANASAEPGASGSLTAAPEPRSLESLSAALAAAQQPRSLEAGGRGRMRCAPEDVRGLWWDQRCPTNTDALQIATESLLDAADTIASSGLGVAGYTLLAMPSCRLLQEPSHREAIAHYFAERGLSLIFSPVVVDDPGAPATSTHTSLTAVFVKQCNRVV